MQYNSLRNNSDKLLRGGVRWGGVGWGGEHDKLLCNYIRTIYNIENSDTLMN